MTHIYAFCNTSSNNQGWYSCVAIAEDGNCICSHVCSHPDFGPHDLGCNVGPHKGLGFTWKHDLYAKAYPSGFDVEWVKHDDPRLQAAFDLYDKTKKETSNDPQTTD